MSAPRGYLGKNIGIVRPDGSAELHATTQVYPGVDEEGDVLIRPPCGHLYGAPLAGLKEAAALGLDAGVRCPDCRTTTLLAPGPILARLREAGLA